MSRIVNNSNPKCELWKQNLIEAYHRLMVEVLPDMQWWEPVWDSSFHSDKIVENSASSLHSVFTASVTSQTCDPQQNKSRKNSTKGKHILYSFSFSFQKIELTIQFSTPSKGTYLCSSNIFCLFIFLHLQFLIHSLSSSLSPFSPPNATIHQNGPLILVYKLTISRTFLLLIATLK